MQVELYCSDCRCRFTVSPGTPAAKVLNRIAEEGPWSSVGDGETLEDRISAALIDQEPLPCPDCGRAATLNEESLGRLSKELLANW